MSDSKVSVGQLARIVRHSKWSRGAVVSVYQAASPFHHREIDPGEIVLVTELSPVSGRIRVYYDGSIFEIGESFLLPLALT